MLDKAKEYMETIEERANSFADKGLPNNIEGTIRYTYIYAANKQKKIDIDNFCEWICNNMFDYQESDYCWNIASMIKDLRKAMLENNAG